MTRAVQPITSKAASVDAVRPDASCSSAKSPSTYAVPHRLLWLTDAAIQVVAFVVAWRLSPAFRPLLTAEMAEAFPWLRWLDFQPASVQGSLSFADIAWIPVISVPATLLFMHLGGGYRPLLQQSRTRLMLTSLLAPVAGLSVVTLALITARNFNTSRALIFLFTLLTAAGFIASRVAVRIYKNRRLRSGQYTLNVLLVAPVPMCRLLQQHFEHRVSPYVRRLWGYLSVPGALESDVAAARVGATHDLPPCLGTVGDLGALLVNHPIHEVVAALPGGNPEWVRMVMQQCDYFHITLRLLPEAVITATPSEIGLTFNPGPLGLPEVELRPRYLDQNGLFVKRLFDILVSAGLLLLLAPLFAIIAVAIKITTPHLPVFYPWRVVGYKGRTFTGYKFTTMVADADDRKADLMHLNEMTGPVFKIKDDPRMTPLGRWLRRFSLNELPQLWSVLKGDMSLVGPRPAYPTELARYELWQKRKLSVQPGITCLWQVRGRNTIADFDDWVRMDFEYIDNWSLWLDCRILARTAMAVFRGTGW